MLLGLALALSANPAAATIEQRNAATPLVQPAQPEQQATPKRIRLTGLERFGDGSTGAVRPGDVVTFGTSVVNDGERREDFVLTFTLPPEFTLVSLRRSNNFGSDTDPCSGNVCRDAVSPGDVENQQFSSFEGKARLASSFRGDSTTIRADLQEDANPDPSARTSTLTVPVAQPAAGQPAAGNTATATGTLPRTGDRTTITAALALCLVLLGAMAQLVGTADRRAMAAEQEVVSA
jgi:hypothetical protein